VCCTAAPRRFHNKKQFEEDQGVYVFTGWALARALQPWCAVTCAAHRGPSMVYKTCLAGRARAAPVSASARGRRRL
jgi:hypothetical protein